MRRLALSILLIFLFTQSDAQHRFSKYYHNDVALRTNNQAKDFIEMPDSGFLFPVISSNLYAVDTLGFAKTYIQIIRTNTYGDTLWTKTYYKKHFNIRVRYIVKMLDGNFLIAGNEFDLVKYHNDTIGSKILLVKITPNGDTLWTKTLDIGDGDEYVQKLINTNDNGFAIFGQVCNRLETNCDMYLMKLDSNANEQWHRTFTWSANFWESPSSVIQTQNGDYYLTSATLNRSTNIQSGYLVKTNEFGNLKWQKLIDNEGAVGTYLTNISIGNSNTLLLCGLMGFGSYTKGWLLRVDTSGVYILNKKIGENTKYTSLVFAQEVNDNIYVQGETNAYHSNKDFNRTCLFKYTSTGEVVWKRVYQDSLNDRGVYITYQTKQTLDGGFAMIGFGDNPKDTLKNQDVWFLKVDSIGCLYDNCLSMGIEKYVQAESDFKVYPNPSNGVINLISNAIISKIQLIDAFGRIVYEDIHFNNQPISISEFVSGIYVLKAETIEGKFITEKIILE